MTELRNCCPEDFEQLWALDQQCFSPEIAYSRQELAYYMRHKSAICLVAWEQKRLCGFILGHPEARGFGHVITLDVDSSARRAGLGSDLMKALEAKFASVGCSSVFLEVAVNNGPALAFYKKHGYSVWKTLRRYYPGQLDGLLMGKSIR
ncbi:MAG TPA: N-acetyltransferase [Terriglobales bacterium]|jgi:ribosomal-protein-alanine N-acetyltransferase|nr:N-acetyltransferase [Terriglobales bacterium]